jgi:hypothetical protein
MCWHCGYELAPPTAVTTTPSSTLAAEEAEPFSLSAVSVYGVLTAVIIIGILLTMRSLGQRPLVLLNPDTNINLGWTPITDPDLQFTFDLPPEWELFNNLDSEKAADFAALLAGEPQLAASVAPLGIEAADTDLLMIVMTDTPEGVTAVPAFVTIARSTVLRQLSLEDTILFAQQNSGDTILAETSLFTSFFGDNRAQIVVEMPFTPDTLTCYQHIAQTAKESYLVVGCAPSRRYGIYRETIDGILSSFQILQT